MKYDQFGQAYATSNDICDLLYKDPDLDITRFLIEDPEQYNSSVKSLYAETSLLKRYHNSSEVSLEEFDKTNQMAWHMPKSYMDLDIAAWVLEKCKTEAELQRVGQELILYQERDLFNLLRFMKYLVDTLRQNKLVWGVGRGSSTASYVLYLIGVHRIDSLFYDLDIAEFLK